MSSSAFSNANLLFNVFDLVAGTLQIIYGCIIYHSGFEGFIIPIYIVILGMCIVLMVFYVPNWLRRNIPFYNNLMGRGLTFVFMALLVIDPSGSGLFCGGYISLVAIMYVSLWLLNKCRCTKVQLPPPFFLSSQQGQSQKFTKQLTQSLVQGDADDDVLNKEFFER